MVELSSGKRRTTSVYRSAHSWREKSNSGPIVGFAKIEEEDPPQPEHRAHLKGRRGDQKLIRGHKLREDWVCGSKATEKVEQTTIDNCKDTAESTKNDLRDFLLDYWP